MDLIANIGAFAYPYTALATLVIMLLVMMFTGTVGRMREKHDIKAPATSGNGEFECAHRVHQNTIEQLVIFLPVLWLFAVLVADLYAGAVGALWIVGRILYARGYMEEPAKRHTGFMIGTISLAIAFFWSFYVVVMQLV